ncbi:MAG: hypothetical protein ABI664_10630 [bacterium]
MTFIEGRVEDSAFVADGVRIALSSEWLSVSPVTYVPIARTHLFGANGMSV